ncbi:MAG: hypothetical protein K6E10_09630 [Eubacterium sp.]|nr:hypothetical protein [Eubacterium sp.]
MINSKYKYYRQILKRQNEIEIYNHILDGLSNYNKNIFIEKSLIDSQTTSLTDILDYVFLDNPGMFFVDTSITWFTYGQDEVEITFIFHYENEEIIKLENKINNIVRSIIKIGEQANLSSKYEWELYLHDFLADKVDYEKGDLSYHKVHSVIGPLLFNRSVCEGYAKAFKLLCDAVNLPCIILHGIADDKKTSENHAWNMVRIDKKYYHVDTTWDSCNKNNGHVNHKLLNVTDYDIGKDHIWDRKMVPQCNSQFHNYYVMNKSYFKNTNQGAAYINSMLGKGIKNISLRLEKCDYSYKELETMIKNGADPVLLNGYNGYRYVYSHDDKRGVINIQFK